MVVVFRGEGMVVFRGVGMGCKDYSGGRAGGRRALRYIVMHTPCIFKLVVPFVPCAFLV